MHLKLKNRDDNNTNQIRFEKLELGETLTNKDITTPTRVNQANLYLRVSSKSQAGLVKGAKNKNNIVPLPNRNTIAKDFFVRLEVFYMSLQRSL